MATEHEAGRQHSQVSLKTAYTVCFAVLSVVALVALVAHTTVALTLTGIATMLTLALEHGVSFLERKGLARMPSIVLVMLGLVAVLAALAVLVIPAAVEQLDSLVVQWPHLWEELRRSRVFQFLNSHFQDFNLPRRPEEAASHLTGGTPLAHLVVKAIGGVVGVVGGALTVFFLVVFMLAFGGGMLRRLLDLTRPEHRLRYVRVLRNVYRATGGYLAGLSLICSVNATLTTTVLAILGVPFFLPLGILSGFSSMVPYAGPAIAGGLITLLTWATGGMWMALGVLVYFVLYGQLEGNVLAPLVFRRTVHVNPLIVLLAVLFCAELAGVVGAVVAVPVAASAQIITRELLSFRKELRRRMRRAPPPGPA